jgi:hypothetical protein
MPNYVCLKDNKHNSKNKWFFWTFFKIWKNNNNEKKCESLFSKFLLKEVSQLWKVKTTVELKYIDENLISMIGIHNYIKYHTNFVLTNTNNLEHT